MSLVGAVWYVLSFLTCLVAVALVCVFRRLVVLFAALDAAEQIEEKAPARALGRAS